MEALTAINPADKLQPPPPTGRAANTLRLRIVPYDAVRTVLGLALLGAAWVKAYSLIFTGVGGVGLVGSTSFQLALFEIESAAGLWLLTGFASRITRWAALGYFALLGCIAAYFGMSGTASCPGCLGSFSVNPWWMFSFDVTAVLALIVANPKRSVGPGTSVAKAVGRFAQSISGWIVISLTCLALLFGGSVVIFGSPAAALGWLRGDRVALVPAVLDLRDCHLGEKHVVEFQLRNDDDQPLDAIGGTTSCKCIATKGLPVSVAPRAQAPILAEIVVAGPPGVFVQTVTIYLNGKTMRMVQAQVRAQISKPVSE